MAGSHSASGSHPHPSHMGFSRVQTGLWHAEPRCELSIPAAVPQGAGTAGDRVPGWLAAIRGGQGQHEPGTLWEVRSPRGAGQGLLSDATRPLGTTQSVNKGSPGVTLHRGCPRSLSMSTGTHRGGPRCGRHPWLAAGRGAGASGRGGRCFAVRTPPSCSFRFPRTVAGRIFSLRRRQGGC